MFQRSILDNLAMAAVWRSYSRLVERFPWSSTILQVAGVGG